LGWRITSLQGCNEPNERSDPILSREGLEAAVDPGHPVRHVEQAVRSRSGRWSIPKPAAIVLDFHHKGVVVKVDAQGDARGLGMPHNVVEGFLGGEEKIVARR
jgi:hypothetical protein